MNALDLKMKQDAENAKAKLDETKQKLSETLSRISKTENEYQEEKMKCNRKMQKLLSLEGTQFFRISKLDGDIKNIDTILQARKDEEDELTRTNSELKEEVVKCKEETTNLDKEFFEKIEGLNEKINSAYLQLQSVKDAEMLLEVGKSSIKSEGQAPYVEDVLRKRKEASKTRQEELKTELNGLEESLKETEKEIEKKSAALATMKVRYGSLIKVYNMSKNAKRNR